MLIFSQVKANLCLNYMSEFVFEFIMNSFSFIKIVIFAKTFNSKHLIVYWVRIPFQQKKNNHVQSCWMLQKNWIAFRVELRLHFSGSGWSDSIAQFRPLRNLILTPISKFCRDRNKCYLKTPSLNYMMYASKLPRQSPLVCGDF